MVGSEWQGRGQAVSLILFIPGSPLVQNTFVTKMALLQDGRSGRLAGVPSDATHLLYWLTLTDVRRQGKGNMSGENGNGEGKGSINWQAKAPCTFFSNRHPAPNAAIVHFPPGHAFNNQKCLKCDTRVQRWAEEIREEKWSKKVFGARRLGRAEGGGDERKSGKGSETFEIR